MFYLLVIRSASPERQRLPEEIRAPHSPRAPLPTRVPLQFLGNGPEGLLPRPFPRLPFLLTTRNSRRKMERRDSRGLLAVLRYCDLPCQGPMNRPVKGFLSSNVKVDVRADDHSA